MKNVDWQKAFYFGHKNFEDTFKNGGSLFKNHLVYFTTKPKQYQ